MLQGLIIMEAIHSVAIEHDQDCGCDVCKAANGDTDALARVWAATQDELDSRRAVEGF